MREIPWSHNLLIMSKVKDSKAREFYIMATRNMRWSRDILRLQIDNQTYEHQVIAKKQNNFEKGLPEKVAQQAAMAMKDIYTFDALGQQVIEAEM